MFNSSPSKEKPAFYTMIFVTVIIAIMALRLFYLQIIAGEYYEMMADNIRARVIPQIAPRGIIFDRYGRILAESKVVYTLDILPYQIQNPAFVFRFLRRIGVNTDKIEAKFQKKDYLPYELLRVKGDISTEQISYIEENSKLLDGVIISSRIIRSYPHDNVCAHILGYVGEIDSTELKKLKKYGYQLGDIVGLAGIERYYDKYLKGTNGGQPLEVDPMGNPVRKLQSMEPVPGSNIYLTIDLGLQKYAERVFGDRKGAVVIVKPDTAEVLAMFSKPNYNPNYFTDFLTEAEWDTIQTKEHPLHNRALSGYPPGSTFKIITLMTVFEDKFFNKRQYFFCPGFFKLSGRRFNCWKAAGHGRIDILNGFVQSCNVVFYNLGLELDPDKIAKTASSFGLGLATGIDLPYEATGSIPTQRWKSRTYDQQWYPGDSLNLAIGQGFVLATPLQMCLVASSLANANNQLLKPYLVSRIVSVEDESIYDHKPEAVGELPFDKNNIATLKKLMAEVVEKGTGHNAYLAKYPVAGKTGTSEVANAKKPHAWFVSFGQVEHPELAMVVLVENGGFGGEVAARISRDIYQWWQENRSSKNEKVH